jgi:hypothetical protein
MSIPANPPLITPALFSHRPPPNREKRENSQVEIDRDEIAASDRLFARRPDAQVWFRQVGLSGSLFNSCSDRLSYQESDHEEVNQREAVADHRPASHPIP